MSIDWEAEVGAPTVAVFGGAALYIPADGTAPFSVNGVFDEGYREVEIVDGLSYTSDAMPVIGINEAQFAGYKPVQNDKLQILDPLKNTYGKIFIVKEPRPDSHGVTKLMLMEYGGSLA